MPNFGGLRKLDAAAVCGIVLSRCSRSCQALTRTTTPAEHMEMRKWGWVSTGREGPCARNCLQAGISPVILPKSRVRKDGEQYELSSAVPAD